jgi:hypothetical protein
VTTHAPATAVVGSSFTVAATAPGGPVTYSSSGSCTNSGALFTMTAAVGTCSVKYDQAGSANYNAAPQVVESVTAVAAATAPDAPTAVSASAGNAQATVVWTAPASNGGSAVTGYDVTRYVAGTAQGTTSFGVVTQTTVTGLTNGTTYTFRVAAKNAVGTGAQSADSNAVTPSAPRFTLTVSKSGSGSGTVTSSVGGINCGATCAADFDAGASVTLTATAASGSTFTGWSGACTGSASCTVTMDAAKSVTATFAPPSPPQTVVNCVVPNVKGKTLAAAKRKIAAGHCKTGKVTTTKSKTVAKGKVISQSPRAGKKLARSAKVNLVVSRGKR